MHIIIGIITLLSVVAAWYWRMKVLSEAARDGAKAIETAANLPRRMKFRRLAGKGGLQVVSDPREAAVILMLEIAKARGPLSARQDAVIRAEIMQHFEFTEADAQHLVAQSAWLSRNAGSPVSIVSRMAKFVANSPALTNKEMIDLDGMLVYVSEAEGSPTEDQLDLLSVFRQKVGLRV